MQGTQKRAGVKDVGAPLPLGLRQGIQWGDELVRGPPPEAEIQSSLEGLWLGPVYGMEGSWGATGGTDNLETTHWGASDTRKLAVWPQGTAPASQGRAEKGGFGSEGQLGGQWNLPCGVVEG